MTAPTLLAPTRVAPDASPMARTVGPPRRNRRFGLLGHAPALDGLRGLAVVMVIVFHFLGHHFLPGGWSGVDIFFGLSGFLITALILDEKRMHGRIDLKRFYARRACRLLPALFFMLFVWVAVLLVFHNQLWMGATPSGDGIGRTIDVNKSLFDVVLALVYVANWNVVLGGSEAPLPHLWSLAVEEQFYILWPTVLLVLLAVTRRSRMWLVGALIAMSAALPWLLWNGGEGMNRVYFGTDTRAVGLLAGAFCALVWHHRRAQGRVTQYGAARAWTAVAFIVGIALLVGNAPAKFLVLPALLAVAVAQLVPYLAESRGALARMFSNRWLVWAGKRSYALYLWNYIWATWTHPLGVWPGVPLGILATLVCTQISWYLIEAPALRYGRRFKISHVPSAPQTQTVALRRAA